MANLDQASGRTLAGRCLCGRVEYRFRLYPKHELLTHPFEMGMMVWL